MKSIENNQANAKTCLITSNTQINENETKKYKSKNKETNITDVEQSKYLITQHNIIHKKCVANK